MIRSILPADPAHTLTQNEVEKHRSNPAARHAADAWLQGIEAFPGVGRRVAACLRSFSARHADNVERRLVRLDDNYSLLLWCSKGGDFTDRRWTVSFLLHGTEILGLALETRAREHREGQDLYPLWETHRTREWGAHAPEDERVDAALAALLLATNRRLQRDAADVLVTEALKAQRQDLLIETPGGHLELNEDPDWEKLSQRGWADLEAELHDSENGNAGKVPIRTIKWAADLLRRLPGAVEGSTSRHPRLQAREETVPGRVLAKNIQKILDAEQAAEAHDPEAMPDWERELLGLNEE
ncbi:MAG: hypothetical protein Q4D96_09150 [Propionibacteriaceae bacterium]|nr:hypothetical protein [Propionibacteriaceae bacterium]